MARATKRRRSRRRSAFGFAALLLPFALLEIALRVVLFGKNDSALIWILPVPIGTPFMSSDIEPSTDHPTNVDEIWLLPPEHPYRVTTNNMGFRRLEPTSIVKSVGTTRIFGLGDSFTFGTGVANTETYPSLVEEILEDRRRSSHEFLNAGVGGYGLEQELALYTTRGHLSNPDLVVLQVLANDVPGYHETLRSLFQRRHQGVATGTFADFLFKGLRRLHRQNPRGSALLDGLYRLKGGSDTEALQQLADGEDIKIEIDGLRLEQETLKVIRHTWSLWTDPSYSDDLMRFQLMNDQDFDALLDFVRSKATSLVVIYFPTRESLTARREGGDPASAYYMQLCASRDIPFLDLSETIGTAGDIRALYLWPWDMHLSPYGNRVAAAAIADFLEPLLP